MDRGWKAKRARQFLNSWRNALTSPRPSGRRRTEFVLRVVCVPRAGYGTVSVRAAGSSGGIEGPPEVEMFPEFPVLFPVCSQSWRNRFFKFPVFWISCAVPYCFHNLRDPYYSRTGNTGNNGNRVETALVQHVNRAEQAWNTGNRP